MIDNVILGAGMAGFGAAYRLRESGRPSVVYEKHGYHGGHAATFKDPSGWIFDDGPHISFTEDKRIQELFAENVDQKYEKLQAYVDNYWQGHRIKHPAICSLHGLPSELVVDILEEFAVISAKPVSETSNYRDWLVARYGERFAATFPMEYTKKYHTTTADNMTTEWCGSRLYRPDLRQVLDGAICENTGHAHYIDHFRYPTNGGFVSYMDLFMKESDVRLNQEAIEIDCRAKTVRFRDASEVNYGSLISSLPLPTLIELIKDVPDEVRAAAKLLACTTAVIVNIGIRRSDISKAHWTYFYDDDVSFARLSFPHMFSPNTAPPGCGSIQAEVYFSEKYRPLEADLNSVMDTVIADLTKCGILIEGEEIVFREVRVAQWAQIIFDRDRPNALSIVHGFLDDVGISYCGRFGEWGYLWTDQSFISGERAAEKALNL